MSVYCPIQKRKVVYLDCLECENRYECKNQKETKKQSKNNYILNKKGN